MEYPLLKGEDISLDGQDNPELKCWLNCESRCFGDKGDVEDITEGQCFCLKTSTADY